MSDDNIYKQKRTRLSYADKLAIICLVESGVDKKTVARQFNVSESTIRTTIFLRKKIKEANEQYELIKRKSSKSSEIPFIDNAVSTWFYQARECGDVITGPIICDKALEFWYKFTANGVIRNLTHKKFTASNGWLHKFKKRHGIRMLNKKGEVSSADRHSVEHFCTELKKKLGREGIQLDNLYNADESGINYRRLSRTTLASLLKSSESESKESGERFTVLFCLNASGSHKLPLFCIGDWLKPRDLENKKLPIIYRGQKGGWMNRDFSLEWYKFTFIPAVEEHQKKTGIRGKVLLLLDNAPSHPGKDVLNAVNPNFEVMYLPPNTTSLIQPCDQGLIYSIKKKYRRKLLSKLHEEKGNNQKIIDILKNTTLYPILILLSAAWDEVQSPTLRKVWKPLLGKLVEEIHDSSNADLTSDTSTDEETDMAFIREIVEDLIPEKEGNPHITQEILEWLNKDDGDFGWKQQSSDEIAAALTQESKKDFYFVGYENIFNDSKQSFDYHVASHNEENHSTTEDNFDFHNADYDEEKHLVTAGDFDFHDASYDEEKHSVTAGDFDFHDVSYNEEKYSVTAGDFDFHDVSYNEEKYSVTAGDFDFHDVSYNEEKYSVTADDPLCKKVSAIEALESMKIVQKWFKQQNDLPVLNMLLSLENKICR